MKNTYKNPPGQSKSAEEGHYEASAESIEAERAKAEAVPAIDPKAFHGLAGEIALAAGERTEADPRGVLVGLLIAFGNVIGKPAFFRVNDTWHHANEFGVVVGESAVARKGLGANIVEEILRSVDPDWASTRISRGFSTGEGLLAWVKDPRMDDVKVSAKNEPLRFERQQVESGVDDKRCLCALSEFGEIVILLSREGNILSSVMRNAWDGRQVLEINSRHKPIRATGAHFSLFGAITRDELLKLLPQIPSFNGFANRYLWVLIERSKYLPNGGPPVANYLRPQLDLLREIAQAAKKISEVSRSEEAEALWGQMYKGFATGTGRAVVDRADAHTLRLSMLFALLDGSKDIHVKHLEAAHALWKYCEACAMQLFRTEELSNDAHRILDYLREKGSEGATRTELSTRVFKGNRTQTQIALSLKELERKKLVRGTEERTDTWHLVERWFAYEQ